MIKLQNENEQLRKENLAMQGSIEDKVAHFEEKQNVLRKLNQDQEDLLANLKAENSKQRKDIQATSEQLNLKIQDSLFKQEKIDSLVAKMDEMASSLAEKENQIKDSEDARNQLDQQTTELKCQLEKAEEERQTAVKITQEIYAAQKQEEEKVRDLEAKSLKLQKIATAL